MALADGAHSIANKVPGLRDGRSGPGGDGFAQESLATPDQSDLLQSVGPRFLMQAMTDSIEQLTKIAVIDPASPEARPQRADSFDGAGRVGLGGHTLNCGERLETTESNPAEYALRHPNGWGTIRGGH